MKDKPLDIADGNLAVDISTAAYEVDQQADAHKPATGSSSPACANYSNFQSGFARQKDLWLDNLEQQANESTIGALRAQLSATQRTNLAGEMTLGIVHDIKNLLFSLNVLIDQQQVKLDPDFQHSLKEATQYGTELVDDLMSFATGDSAVMAALDLSKLLINQNKFLHWLLPLHIRLTWRLEDRLPVMGSPIQLRQMLTNLVLNARDAMPAGGEVTVSTFADGKMVVMRVSDTGPGIAPGIQDKIFQPLFSTKQEGSGIGLSLTRDLVHRHGGSITFETHYATSATGDTKPASNAQGRPEPISNPASKNGLDNNPGANESPRPNLETPTDNPDKPEQTGTSFEIRLPMLQPE